MFLRAASQAVYAKLEPTYNTLTAPALAADVMRVYDLNMDPLAADVQRDQVVTSAWGNSQAFHDGVHVTMDFKMYLTGAGTAGNEPLWGLFAKVSGNAATVVPITDVTYNPISADGLSCTMYIAYAGNRHPVTGVRGNISYHMDAKKRPYIQFRGMGLFGTPVAHVAITQDLTDIVHPVPVGNANTTCTLHGETVNMVNFMYDQGNKLAFVDVSGYEGIDVDDREPKGELTIMAPLVATKNWFEVALNGDIGPLIIEHGTGEGDGNHIRIEMQAAQLLLPKYVTIDGKQGLKFEINPMPGIDTAGNDEFLAIVS